MRILFVTPEFDDFIQVGGLAAVSAALPRALMSKSTDVRIILPGYRSLMSQLQDVETVGGCPALAAMPACQVGRSQTDDGLPIYVCHLPGAL